MKEKREISNQEYHQADGISKSVMDAWNRSPWHYQQAISGQREINATTQKTFDIGTAVHTAVLEPEKFENEIISGPDARGNSNEWKNFVADHPAQIVLKPADHRMVLDMAESVFLHPKAHRLLQKGQAEASYFWEDHATGRQCKCRPDYARPDLHTLIDLKTCIDGAAHPAKFEKYILVYRYYLQAAFYLQGASFVENHEYDTFAFICVEKAPPYLVSVCTLSPDWIIVGKEEARITLRDIAEFEQSETPSMGYPEIVHEIPAPEWWVKTKLGELV